MDRKTLPFISRGEVDRFIMGLRQAIFDKKLEATFSVKYYYDTDVIIWTVLGFRAIAHAIPEPSAKLLFVRALQAAGYLGKAYLLRPHALELDRLLRRQPTFLTNRSTDVFRDLVADFLVSRGITSELEDLIAIVKGDSDPDDKITLFLDVLKGASANTFTCLELVHGSWEQRFRRVMGSVLKFDELEDDLQHLVRSPATWELNRAITAKRGAQFSLNNLTDAVGLGILERRIRAREADRSMPFVRFHTATESLKRIWQSDKSILERFVYSSQTVDGDDACRLIFRDMDYFIVRACFECLNFEGVERVEPSGGAITLRDLEGVEAQLSLALVSDDRKLTDALGEIRIGERPLGDVITEIESLSFISSVWTRYKPTESLRRMITGLGDLWSFAEDEETRKRIRIQVTADLAILKRELTDQVSHLQRWYELLTDVQKHVDRVRKALRGEPCVPHPYRDLGLVRWDVELSADGERKLVDYCTELFGADSVAALRVSAQLAQEATEISDRETCAIVAELLWFLGLFSRVVDTINALEDASEGYIPPGFIVWRAAARLRAKTPFSSTEKERFLENLLKLRERIGRGATHRLLIGIAYVHYYAWYTDHVQDGASIGNVFASGEEASSWIRLSCDLGEEAVNNMRGVDSLGWAFAVNHCAYVGMMTGITASETEQYLDTLAELRGDGELWNYRFADTLAWSEYLSVLAELRPNEDETGEPTLDDIERTSLCARLRGAREILVGAEPYYGDPEIPQHLLQIERLLRRVRC